MDRRFQGVNTEIEHRFDAAEWQTRVDLAACYRLVAAFGMTDLIYNHITALIRTA
jgi:ribulose-5-phosphate 4-epimerase/fuculose-1-phosphate aldolase